MAGLDLNAIQAALSVAVNKILKMQPCQSAIADCLKEIEAAQKTKAATEEDDEVTIMEQHADDVMAAAVTLEPDVTTTLLSLADEFSGTMDGLPFKFKGKGSLMRKLKKDLAEARLMALEKTGTTDVDLKALVWDVGDAFRYTMLLPTERYTEGVTATMERLKKDGRQAVKLKNYWPGGDAYQGINDNFAVICGPSPSGLLKFELQFHTPESFTAKMEEGHRLYEIQRTSSDPVKKMAIFKQQAAVAASVPVPPGVLDIPFTKNQPLPGEANLYAALVLARAMASQDSIVAAVRAALDGGGASGGEEPLTITVALAAPSDVERALARVMEADDDDDDTCELRQAVSTLSMALVVTAEMPHASYTAQATAAVAAVRSSFKESQSCNRPAFNGWQVDNTARGTAWPNHCLGIWLPLLGVGKEDGVAFTDDDAVPFTLVLQTAQSARATVKLQAMQQELESATTKYERGAVDGTMRHLRSTVAVPEGADGIAV